MTFAVLTVCTGNVCRSPVAELLLANALRDVSGFEFGSAGTRALLGKGVPPTTLAMSREYGLNASEHRARQLTDDQIRGADLIITMAREHRRAVVERVPGAVRRTFTLRELARIVDGTHGGIGEAKIAHPDASDALREAVSQAAARRGSVGPTADPNDLDVIDPFGQPETVYRRSFEQLIPAAQSVARFLGSAATGDL